MIGQSLSDDALYRFSCTRPVIDAERHPLIVSEIELAEIAFKVLLANVVIHAVDASFQD